MKNKDCKIQLLLTFGLMVLTAVGVQGTPLDGTNAVGISADRIKPSGCVNAASHFDQSADTFAPTVDKVAPAVVRIVTTLGPDAPADLAGALTDPAQLHLLERVLGGRSPHPGRAGLGSGVIVTEDGYILTNSHLLAGAKEVEVALQDGRSFKATIIGLDMVADVAVVKIDAQHLPTVPLAESANVRVGDVVLAIGYPFGVGQTVTHGIVSAIDRGGMGIEDYENFIQTDAPINPGNSGGALVDVHGKLIGINTAILSNSGGNLGIGFAVPSDLAGRVLEDLRKY